MEKRKKARLETNGWRVGSAEELLSLSPDEAAYVELRLKQPAPRLRPPARRSAPPARRAP